MAVKTLIVSVAGIVGFIMPVFVVGYMNLDITYISTTKSWSNYSRAIFLLFSTICLVASIALASMMNLKQ